MSLNIRHLVVTACVFLQACSLFPFTEEKEPLETHPAPLPISELTKQQTKTAPFMLRGKLVMSHDTQTFTPCNSNQQYWAVFNDLQQTLINNSIPASSEPLYAELVVTLSETSPYGVDRDYTAKLNVSMINLISTENPNRCSASPQSTRAFGTEPFWSLALSKNQVTYRTPEQSRVFDHLSSSIKEKRRDYQFEDGQLTLTQSDCNDGMSDSLYGWKSKLSLMNNQLKGCATLANVDNTASWAGVYQATSTQPQPFSVTVELNDDHSAKTYYRYQDNQPERREMGYWQQINPDQVQVVMTSHQGQRLIAERIFTREENRISTDKEKINGHIYTIANQGLVLYKTDND